MLKITQVKLDLIKDINMWNFIEEGVRGGYCAVSKKLVIANNKFLQNFDPAQPSTYILYFDAVNLYGGVMETNLPYKDFYWEEEPEKFNFFEKRDEENDGCILEVDLHIPSRLHNVLKDFPLIFTHEEIGKTVKLVGTLYDKEKYIIHIKNLRYIALKGVVVKRIHRVLRFKQRSFLKNYVQINSRLRRMTHDKFTKNQCKAMNNKLFGKTMEDSRKYTEIKLINNNRSLKRYLSKPHFKRSAIFSENLAAVQMKKTKVLLCRPIYVGFAILELAKLHMYKMHYDTISPLLDCTLCYTGKKTFFLSSNDANIFFFSDTDSLLYEVRHLNPYTVIRDNLKHFDTSNYCEGNMRDMPQVNESVVLKLKDEVGGKIIKEFVGLRAKLYGYKLMDDVEVKKSKGVKSVVVERKITHDDYKKCLMNKVVQKQTQCTIRSKNHDLFTVAQEKITICPYDDKRMDIDNFCTVPFGYLQCNNNNNM